MKKTLKLDIGSGGMVKPGFTSVDLYAPADIKDDITALTSIADSSVDVVNTDHVLEHLCASDVPKACSAIYRVLKPGALWTIEVPDLPWVLQDFLNTPEEKRWGWKLQTVFGLQSRPGEFHLTGFSAERLGKLLARTGFTQIRIDTHYSHHYNQGVINASAIKPK